MLKVINYFVLGEINNSQFALHFNESGSDCLALAVKLRLCQVSINTNREISSILLTPQPQQPAGSLRQAA